MIYRTSNLQPTAFHDVASPGPADVAADDPAGARGGLRCSTRDELSRIPKGGEEGVAAPPRCEIAVLFALASSPVGLRTCCRMPFRCAPNFVEHAGTLANRSVGVAETGIGRQAAAAAAEDIVALHRPAWVISAGFAGALVPGLRRGHILMADEVTDGQHRLSVGLHIDRAAIAASADVARRPAADCGCGSRAPTPKNARYWPSFIPLSLATWRPCQLPRYVSERGRGSWPCGSSVTQWTMSCPRRSKGWLSRIDGCPAGGRNRRTVESAFESEGHVEVEGRRPHRASDRLAKFLVGVIEQLDVRPAAPLRP